MNRTAISWVRNPHPIAGPGFTWNVLAGCKATSPGCAHCYAARLASARLAHLPQYQGLAHDGKWSGEVRFFPEKLAEPLRRRTPSGIFLNDMSDTFHESATNEQIAAMYGVMAATPDHQYFVCTKRARRRLEWFEWMRRLCGKLICPEAEVKEFARRMLLDVLPKLHTKCPQLLKHSACESAWPLPNVIELTSVEDQATADERIPDALATPAAVRGLSMEPLLEEVDLSMFTSVAFSKVGRGRVQRSGIDWVIVGGESGSKARPCQVGWIRSIVRQCREASVPVFVKQLGSNCQARNDENWTADEGDPDFPKWPDHLAGEDRLEELPNGGYQGAPLRIHFRDRAGANPDEWAADLRVRQMPEVRR